MKVKYSKTEAGGLKPSSAWNLEYRIFRLILKAKNLQVHNKLHYSWSKFHAAWPEVDGGRQMSPFPLIADRHKARRFTTETNLKLHHVTPKSPL